MLFSCCDLDLHPMTLIQESDLDNQKTDLHNKNKLPTSKHQKLKHYRQTERQTRLKNLPCLHSRVVRLKTVINNS